MRWKKWQNLLQSNSLRKLKMEQWKNLCDAAAYFLHHLRWKKFPFCFFIHSRSSFLNDHKTFANKSLRILPVGGWKWIATQGIRDFLVKMHKTVGNYPLCSFNSFKTFTAHKCLQMKIFFEAFECLIHLSIFPFQKYSLNIIRFVS